MIYPINPVAKPRMTRSDKWKKRPATTKYWKFKDLCRLHKVELAEAGVNITFFIPMPKSWSKKKKALMAGTAHQQRPDLSNLLKAIEDAVYEDDSVIWSYGKLEKLWSYGEGSIVIC